MNEELLTAIRDTAMRSLRGEWYQPYEMAKQTGVNDAEFIAAMSPEMVLDLVYEIKRRFAIQAVLNALRTRTNQLISESNKYAAEISLGKSATIKMGIQLDEAKETINALQLALETERSAANLYAKQVAHWIGKHDALLEQQLATTPQEWNDENVIAWCVARGIKAAQPEQRTGGCTLCGHCAATGEKIQPAQPKQEPLTQAQRSQVFDCAETSMRHNPNLSWRDAICDALESAHGIGDKT